MQNEKRETVMQNINSKYTQTCFGAWYKVFLLLLFTFASCCPSRTNIYTIVKRTHNKGNDTIDFSEAICFDWDKIYWFPIGYSLDYINSIVNINAFWQDVGDRIIFVKNGRVVYHREYFPCHETPLKRISFNPDSALVFQKDNALFAIEKVSDKLYILSHIPKTMVGDTSLMGN